MKKKYALFALCLPIAFTACQNEEFVKDYSQELKNRGEIDVVISASYPTIGNSLADTRMGATEDGNSLSFLWEKDTDKLGAALMDETNPGQVNGAIIYNNYPFIAQSSGATSGFASPSSITKGIYLFYNSYKDVVDRAPLTLSLKDPQVYDPADTKTPAQQMAKYMNMVAPMVDLNQGVTLADAAEFKLPLEFVNLYTPVKVPVIFTNAPAGTKLTKITINGASDFVLGGKLNPSVLAGDQKPNVLSLEEGTINPEKLKTAKEAIDAIVQVGANDDSGIYNASAGKVEGAAVLSIKDGVDLSNGEVKNFWILIPRGTYTSLVINAETTNGNMAEKTINISSEDVNGLNPQEFTAATRQLSELEIDFSDNGNVDQPTELTINTIEDWNNYVQYIKDHGESYLGRDIKFTIGANKSIYISSLPRFGFTLAGTDATTSKLILGNEDKSAMALSVDLSAIKIESNVNLTVGEGATVTFTKAQKDGTINSLTNNGTLTLKAVTAATEIINNQTVNFDFTDAAEQTVAKITNKSKATVNVKSATEFTAFTNEADATIKVAKEATLKLPGTANAGTIENRGDLKNAASFTNNGTIDNYGTLTVTASTYTNNGKIIAQDGSKSNNAEITNTNGVVEVINPTAFGALTSGNEYNISGGTTTAVVTNRTDYLAAKTASMTITLGGNKEWGIVADDADLGTTDLKVDELANFNLQANLNVKVADAGASDKDITVTGDATIKASTKGNLLKVKSLTVAQNVIATIDATATVVVPNLSASENAVIVNGKLNNNGVVNTPENVNAATGTSDVKKFNILIAPSATLTNSGTIGGELNTQAVIAVNGNLNNSAGTIYGDNKLDNAQSYTKGTVYKFAALKANKADLTDFAGAKEIEAITTPVTTIPENTNIKFTIASTGLALGAGTYGDLIFDVACTISASAPGVTVNKITIAENITLTVSGSGNAFTCNTLVNEGTLTDGDSKMTIITDNSPT